MRAPPTPASPLVEALSKRTAARLTSATAIGRREAATLADVAKLKVAGLYRIKGIGRKTVREVRETLFAAGLSFADEKIETAERRVRERALAELAEGMRLANEARARCHRAAIILQGYQ